VCSSDLVIVAVSEGIKNKEGKYVAESDRGGVDLFGHAKLGGAGAYLEGLIAEKLADKKLKTRNIEFSILQRVGSHIASEVDFKEAVKVGEKGVEYALAGKTDVMVAIKRAQNNPYIARYEEAPLDDVANFERAVPKEWITEDGTDVSQEMMEYLLPLIQGEHTPKFENGLPVFWKFEGTE
jgi:6-phosphofructokinase 1